MSQPLNIDQLRREECFLALTAKQQRCVEIFLETGDKLKAVQTAYACKSQKSAKVLRYGIFANPRIVAALAVATGEDAGLVAFKKTLEDAIKNPRLSIAQSNALKLFAQLHGYLKSADEPTPVSVVGFEGPADSYADLPDAAPPAQGLQRISEFEREAASASCDDNPYAPHNAVIRRDDFIALLNWRQAGQGAGNFWDGQREQQYQAALQIERDYWKQTIELSTTLWAPRAVGRQWDAATLALAVSELGLSGDIK